MHLQLERNLDISRILSCANTTSWWHKRCNLTRQYMSINSFDSLLHSDHILFSSLFECVPFDMDPVSIHKMVSKNQFLLVRPKRRTFHQLTGIPHKLFYLPQLIWSDEGVILELLSKEASYSLLYFQDKMLSQRNEETFQ